MLKEIPMLLWVLQFHLHCGIYDPLYREAMPPIILIRDQPFILIIPSQQFFLLISSLFLHERSHGLIQHPLR